MPGVGQPRARAGMMGSRTNRQTAPGFWSQVGNQTRAAAEGALDSATFGLDDQLAAGAYAAGDWFRGKKLGAAYKQHIAEQHARDAYDAAHYGAARTLGTVASLFIPGGGVGAVARLGSKVPQIARMGGMGAKIIGKLAAPAAKVVPRIKQATALSGKERAVIAVAGGGVGAAGQGFSDITQGRWSSLRDYAGAFAGGSAEAMAALRGNPKLAAAIGGATTSLAQDALNERAPSAANAAKSAYASMVLASAAGAIGTRKAAQATIKQKEKLGEAGSILRTLANLDWTISTKKERFHLKPVDGRYSEGFTYPDQRTALDKLARRRVR